MNRLFLLVTVCITVFTSNVFACGGGLELSDEEIAVLSYVTAAQEKMVSTFGQPVVIESIVRSGNDILDLDKNATVSAMCAANYINVYFTTAVPSELLCKTTFEINNQGQADLNGLRVGISCRRTNTERPIFLEINFQQ
jgi:hypothetical protein